MYKKLKIFCSRIYKKEHKKYFDKSDVSKITENKAIWENTRPIFLRKENSKFEIKKKKKLKRN